MSHKLNKIPFYADKKVMKVLRFFPLFKKVLGPIGLSLVLASCSESELAMTTSGSSVYGSIAGFSSLSNKISHSVSAFSCTAPQAEIYTLDADGVKSATALATTAVASDGTFVFRGVTGLATDIQSSKVKFIISVSGCTDTLSRPLTGKKNQEISLGSTLVEKVSLIEYSGKKSLSETQKTEIESLIDRLNQLSGSDLNAVYTQFLADLSASTGFQAVFGVPVNELQYSLPTINALNAPTSVDELVTAAFSISASHWHPSYTVAYIWKLDGSQVSTSANYNYIPSKTSQGMHTVELFVGKSDGLGGIDTTKAYVTKSFALTVNDVYQPTPPVLTLTSSSPTNSQNVTLSMNTGAALANCDSFSTLALTEDTVTAPIAAGAYTITCTSAGSQTINYTLTTGDGVHTLRLWARDSAGNISATPRTISVALDQTAPAVSLTDLASTIRGGSSQSLVFTKSDATSGLSLVKLQYAADGISFADVSTITSSSSPQAWISPSTDVTGAKLKIVATDNAGNNNSATTAAFNIDSTAPTAPTISLSTGAFSNSTSVGISATCIADYDKILYSQTSTTPAITDSNWEACSTAKTFTIASGDGSKSVYAFTKDAVGNISLSSSISMVLDQTNPSISLTSLNSGSYQGGTTQALTWSLTDTNLSSTPVNIAYSTDNGSNWTSLATNLSNDGTESVAIPTVDTNQFKFKVSACDLANNCSSTVSSSSLLVDSTGPQFTAGQFIINSGAAGTGNNSLAMALQATDNLSNITHFCFKYTTGATAPTAPNLADSCWIAVNSPSPGISPAQSISFSNFYYLVGYTTGTYTVYGWLRDNLNNVSTLTNSGAGTNAQDKDSIFFDPGLPPVIVNVIATNTDSPSSPATQADLTIASGGDVYIKWKLTDDYALPSTPVTLYYTLNETTFTQIVAGVSNSANSGCTVDGTTYTGCYRWASGAPTAGYFKVRVAATDSSNMTAFSSASPNNMSTFKVIAGNTDPGLGGSASSALIFNYTNQSYSDARTLVVTPNGLFFVRDNSRGILKIDPADGKLVSFIPYTGTVTNGSIGTATLGSSAARMILDYQGNLLIYDTGAIRKVNLTTNTVTTIIGGGASTTSGVAATSLQLSCINSAGSVCPIRALPNGDIYFVRTGNTVTASGGNIWHYSAADGNVYAMVPTGTGTSVNASRNIATSLLTHFNFEFNPITSTITKLYGYFHPQPCVGCGVYLEPAELDITTGVSTGTGHPLPSASLYHTSVTSMDGKIYDMTEQGPRILYRLDTSTNTFVKVLGGTATGTCADGTAATSCNVYLQDAFITAQGNVFFLDNGLIRTIDENGQVRTLFGQRKTFGDGGLATSARFNLIYSIDETSTGKIAVLDFTENILREFTVGGNITSLMGNGTTSAQTDNSTALTQPTSGGYWGNQYQIYVDRSNDDIYMTGTSNRIVRYTRSTGNLNFVIGGGGTAYHTGADGLVGTSVLIPSYPPQILGFDGSKLLVATNIWNGSAHEKNYWKLYDKTDSYRQSHFAGNNTLASGSFSADGTVVSAANVPWAFQDINLRGIWDSVASTWYFLLTGSTSIKSLPPSGNIATLATLPRAPTAWTMITNASSQKVVYYCSSGRIYKYNLSTSTETAMAWPSSSISCTGHSMFRSSSRNSIVFPFLQNNLMGIAEIIDTP